MSSPVRRFSGRSGRRWPPSLPREWTRWLRLWWVPWQLVRRPAETPAAGRAQQYWWPRWARRYWTTTYAWMTLLTRWPSWAGWWACGRRCGRRSALRGGDRTDHDGGLVGAVGPPVRGLAAVGGGVAEAVSRPAEWSVSPAAGCPRAG